MPTLVDLTTRALTAGHRLEDVEAAVVAAYCRTHQLTPATGSATATIVTRAADGSPAVGVADQLTAADSLTLDDLVMAFETLVPAQEARAYGAVFTPETITSFMAAEACTRADAAGADLATATAIDPAVGCGALLVALVRELVTRTGQQPSTVASRMTGIDISPASIHRARLLLELTTLTLGDLAVPTPRLLVGDALTDPVPDAGTYTIVIGNPPYVRYQQLPETRRTDLAATWATCGPGNFNLYFPFLELAATLAGGVVALITPNGFLTSLSGKPVRGWLAEHRWVDDIVDFGHHRVFGAMTYTAITFASSRTTGPRPTTFGYADVAGLPDLAGLPADWATTRTSPIAWDGRTDAPWRLVGPTRADAVDAITSTGTPLHQAATLRFGLATLRDKLYLLDGTRDSHGNYLKVHNQVTYTIEAGITRRCVKVSGIPDPAALAATGTRILYPYQLTDGRASVLPEDHLATAYPGAYAYLRAIRDELAQRDKGTKTYAAWYAYGRTQGLVPTGPKLLTPLYAGAPRFLLDTDPDAVFCNGCAVTAGPDTDLETLAWVLNSGVCHFYVESTANAISGGFFAYQKKQLGDLGIPHLTDPQRTALREAATDGERDDILAGIYQITLPAGYRRH